MGVVRSIAGAIAIGILISALVIGLHTTLIYVGMEYQRMSSEMRTAGVKEIPNSTEILEPLPGGWYRVKEIPSGWSGVVVILGTWYKDNLIDRAPMNMMQMIRWFYNEIFEAPVYSLAYYAILRLGFNASCGYAKNMSYINAPDTIDIRKMDCRYLDRIVSLDNRDPVFLYLWGLVAVYEQGYMDIRDPFYMIVFNRTHLKIYYNFSNTDWVSEFVGDRKVIAIMAGPMQSIGLRANRALISELEDIANRYGYDVIYLFTGNWGKDGLDLPAFVKRDLGREPPYAVVFSGGRAIAKICYASVLAFEDNCFKYLSGVFDKTTQILRASYDRLLDRSKLEAILRIS